MKNLILGLAFFLLSPADTSALVPEIPEGFFPIAAYSRPCCTFVPNYIGFKSGSFAYMGKGQLGDHKFARLPKTWDKVGIVYTCRAGFVDIAHLRDTTDWSGHIYAMLPQWLGSGEEVLARNEGGWRQRSVTFPKMDVSDLTEDDRELLAVSITWNLALMHEIVTSFPIPVSTPWVLVGLANEMTSAFSIEDAFSNLQGAWIGAKAARHELPFNDAVTKILNSQLEHYEARSKDETAEAFRLVMNKWWRPSRGWSYRNVKKRDFTYIGDMTPHLVPDAPFCAKSGPLPINIPEKLSNGRSVHEYYSLEGNRTARLQKWMNGMDLRYESAFISQRNFPEIVEAIKLKFKRLIGPDIEVFP